MSSVVIAAVIFSAVLHAGWNGLLRNSPDRSWTANWIGVSTFVVCAPFLPLVGWPSKVWPYILASAALHVVYLWFLAQAYKLHELSFAYPIARGTSPILVSLGGLMIAAEKPTTVQAVGIAATVGGIVTIGLQAERKDKTGLIIAMVTGVIVAVYTVIDGLGARHSGLPTQYNLWCFSVYGLAMLIIQLAGPNRMALKGSPKQLALAFGGGLTSVIAYAIITWAMVSAPFGIVSALRETSTLFAAAIGLIFLKEQFSVAKLVGCLVIVSGAIMIAVG